MKAQDILKEYPHISSNILPNHLENLLDGLEKVLPITGDVVELGCHAGLTSVYLRRMLDAYNSKKEFHAYDSFQGLPAKTAYDKGSAIGDHFVQGYFDLKGTWQIEERFKNAGLQLPIIHKGWFQGQTYPDHICFAFLDGDFYSSIMDSLWAVWDKMSPGGIVFIHDYGWDALPGVKQACDEFFGEGIVTNLKGMGYVVKD